MAAHNLFSGFLLGAPALPAWLLAGSLECQLLDTVVFLFEYSVELEKLSLGGCAAHHLQGFCHCNLGLGVLVVKHGAQLLALDLLQHLP